MTALAFDTESCGLNWWDENGRAFLVSWADDRFRSGRVFTVGAAGTPPRLLHAPGDTPAAWHFRLETIAPHHYLAVGVSSDVPRTFSVEPFPVELISA